MSRPVSASLTTQVLMRAFTERPRHATAAFADGFSLI